MDEDKFTDGTCRPEVFLSLMLALFLYIVIVGI